MDFFLSGKEFTVAHFWTNHDYARLAAIVYMHQVLWVSGPCLLVVEVMFSLWPTFTGLSLFIIHHVGHLSVLE